MTKQQEYLLYRIDLDYLQRDVSGPLTDDSLRALRHWAGHSDWRFGMPEDFPTTMPPQLHVELSNRRTHLPEVFDHTACGLTFVREDVCDARLKPFRDCLDGRRAVFSIAFDYPNRSEAARYVGAVLKYGHQQDLGDHSWIDWKNSRFVRVKSSSLENPDKGYRIEEDNLLFDSGQEAEAHMVRVSQQRSRNLSPLFPTHLALSLDHFPALLQFEHATFVNRSAFEFDQPTPPKGIEVFETNAFSAELTG